jgi:signal transduction histidine kinase/CheY-like chemotaxis protein
VRTGAELLGALVTAEDHAEADGLRAQLALVTDQLQATSEEMEQANEELRVANEELQTANAELQSRLAELQTAQEAIRHKDDFLAMLAHELRNPLAPILSSTHVLRVQPDNPAGVQRAREVIERQVRHQARLLDDLLDVSRVTRGRIELRRRPVDLRAIVAEALESARSLIEGRRIELSSPASAHLVPVEADPIRLAQVVFNLLSNAAKYTPPGGRITVTAERESGDAVLRVLDSGVGIPAHMLGRIFELFTQVAPSLARSQGGLGIGLTLVKSLVEMHGGTVEAHSAGPGQGSEFIVRLPLTRAVTDQPTTGATPAAARRILIVEDNTDAREMLHTALALEGHRVLASEDGGRGIELALRHRPEIVLIDIGLPGLSGYEVARRIRTSLGDRVKLVALTGYGQPGDRQHAREAGFDAHLVKPVGLEDLQAVL